jgi:hypothetical protein
VARADQIASGDAPRVVGITTMLSVIGATRP